MIKKKPCDKNSIQKYVEKTLIYNDVRYFLTLYFVEWPQSARVKVCVVENPFSRQGDLMQCKKNHIFLSLVSCYT